MRTESPARNLSRSIGMAVLLSMVSFYAIHVFGEWRVENYRPDPETTSSLQLHNKCLVLESNHILWPNTDMSKLHEGISGPKLTGSFMNFFDGHIAAMIIFAAILTGLIYFLRKRMMR